MKNLWKKTQKLIICTLVFAMMFTMSAAAAETVESNSASERTDGSAVSTTIEGKTVRYTKGTIDTSVGASLTLYKYSNKTVGTDKTGKGVPTTDLPAGVKPLTGVTFKYYKVAEIATGAMTADNINVSLKYKWVADNRVSSALSDATLELVQGKEYSSDELQSALDRANAKIDKGIYVGSRMIEKAVNAVVGNNNTLTTAGAEGSATAGGIAQGLYLIVEYSAPATVTEKTAPFLVSLPMTNIAEIDGNPEGSVWQYDVYVYPKNVEEVPEIEKNIEVGDKEEKYIAADIGEEVTFILRATIPDHINSMSTFTVEDTMESGLSFVENSAELTVDGQKLENVELDDTTSPGILKWVLIKSARDNTTGETTVSENKLTGKGGKILEIRYRAVLNKDCIIGRWGNANGVELLYNHNNSVVSIDDSNVPYATKSRVYTFGIDITKTDNEGNRLSDVEFKLYRDEKLENEIKVTKDDNGYYVADNGADTIKTADGTVRIYGLKEGTYYLKETKTNADCILLKEPIKVTIKAEPSYELSGPNGETGSYTKPEETYYQLNDAGEYVPVEPDAHTNQSFATGKYYTLVSKDDGTSEYVQANLEYPQLKAVSEEGYTGGDTIAITVVNNKQFAVPTTGGMGTWAFTVCGAVIIVAALGLILIRKKRSMAR